MKKVLFTFLTVTLISGLTFGQDYGKKGCFELGGQIGFDSETAVVNGEAADESTTTITLAPYAGYFIMDGFELGFMPMYTSVSMGDDSQSFYNLFFVPSYSFVSKSNIVPFIEGLVGLSGFKLDVGGLETDGSGISFGGGGGIKILIGKGGLIKAGVYYLLLDMSPEGADKRFGSNLLSLMVGAAVALGK